MGGEGIWTEPVRGGAFGAELAGLAGLDRLRLLLAGKLPRAPLSYLTGLHATAFGPGVATFAMPVTGWLAPSQGPVPGGVVAILGDAALGCAIQTVLGPAVRCTTTELSVNMIRPAPGRGMLTSRAHNVHVGRRMALSETTVTDGDGRSVAHCSSWCLVFPPLEDVPPPPDVTELVEIEPDDADYVAPFARPVEGEVLSQDVFDKLSGLDIMRELVEGGLPLPPLSQLTGARPTEAGEGTCTFTMPASKWLTPPTGAMQGGVVAMLADLSMAGAMTTTLPSGTALATLDLRVQYVRPVAADGRLLSADATVTHRGHHMTAAWAQVTDDKDKVLAMATSSALLLPGRRADLSDLAGD